MMLNQTSAQALATFVTRIRPDWDHPGVMAALSKASNLGTATQIARALINLAENPDLRTPAILASPGSHWRNSDGTQPARRGDNDVHCPEHPSNVHPCPQCATKKCTPDPVEHADYLEAKAKLKGRQGPAPREQRYQPTPNEELARARARADRGAARRPIPATQKDQP